MIRVPTVTVVVDGEMLGEMPTEKALQMAQEKGLDLVEVAPNQKPPVCKIMSWSKFKYEEKKKLRKAKVKGKAKEMKEMRFPIFIDKGDLDHKLKRVREFLGKGHKVRLTVFFKGRSTPELGGELVKRILTELEESCTIQQPLKKQGRRWFLVVEPGKSEAKNKKEEDNAKVKDKKDSSQKAEKKEAKNP